MKSSMKPARSVCWDLQLRQAYMMLGKVLAELLLDLVTLLNLFHLQLRLQHGRQQRQQEEPVCQHHGVHGGVSQ